MSRVAGGARGRRTGGCRPGSIRERARGSAVPRAARAALAAASLLAGLLTWSSPALAQNHTLTSTFGEAGSAAGQLSAPRGIAVNETTGNVYVTDSANNRVDVFDGEGKFVEAWGWGVKTGAKAFEICTTECKAGIAGTGQGQFHAPEAIAIDNSGGKWSERVYVGASNETKTELPDVQRFAATGEALGRLASKEIGTVGGVGVDGQGRVFLYRKEEEAASIEEFVPKGGNKVAETFFSEANCAQPGFAVSPDGNAYYANHQLEVEESCPSSVTPQTPILTAKLTHGGELVYPAATPEATTGVAVDPVSGDLLIDNGGSVAVFSANGKLIERFGAGSLKQGGAVAIDGKTGTIYVAEPGSDQIQVFNLAPAAPTILSTSAQSLTPSTAKLSAVVDAEGAATHYTVQYGAAPCTSNACTDVASGELPAGYAPVPVGGEATGLQPSATYYYRVVLENAHGSVEAQGSFQTLPSPAGVLADNRGWELVSPAQKNGNNVEPMNAANAPQSGLIEAAESGGAITYVTTGAVGPEVEGNRPPESPQILSTRSSSGWGSRDIATPNEKAEGVRAGAPSEYRFFTGDLATAIVEPVGLAGKTYLQEPPLVAGVQEEQRGVYRRNNAGCVEACYQRLLTPENAEGKWGGLVEFAGASPDTNHVILESGVALVSSAASGNNLYEWNASEPNRLTLVNIAPVGEGGKLEPLAEAALGTTELNGKSLRNAVSADGSRVIFSNGEGTNTRLYLRDVSKGETIQVNKVEEGHGLVEPEVEDTAHEHVTFQTATPDGKRIYFSDSARLTADSNLAPTEAGSPSDLYECEVIEEAGKLKGCKLTDLTANQNAGEPGGLQGAVIEATPSGYVYFVANGALTPGAEPGNCTEGGASLEQHCNLYVRRPDGQLSLIARLSGADGPTWDGGFQAEPNIPRLSSRVSPSGVYLAFMSSQSITGYNNVDANPAAKGARDEEVFLYDAEAGRVVCASCNPTGAQPKGIWDNVAANGAGGPTVDEEGVWRKHWLAASIPGWTGIEVHASHYQSRYLSDQGRLFFNSADPIVTAPSGAVTTRTESVPGAKEGETVTTEVGVENVYEYEPSGVGSCSQGAACVSLVSSGTSSHESAFMDASVSGDDVFFITTQPLVSIEHESSYSLYDAHVCSSASPCIQSPGANNPPCGESNCRPGTYTQSPLQAPGSGATHGPEVAPQAGALPAKETVKPPKKLTRAEKLALALKSCKKKYKGKKHAKKRAQCERTARKLYGPKKSNKKKGKK